MIIYHAGTVGDERKLAMKHRLLSYADHQQRKITFQYWYNLKLEGKKIFIDSGAYSAHTRGIKIEIRNYIEYIKTNLENITTYAGLDVIGDWRTSRGNIEIMQNNGLEPLPTFHLNSPINELHRLCKEYDYIALGGLVGSTRNTIKVWLDKCWNVIGRYWPKKIHGFGLTAQWALEKYPFYSCDSTVAIIGGGLGQVITFDKRKAKMKNWKSLIKDGKLPYLGDNFRFPGSAHIARRVWNVEKMIEFEKYLTQLWKRRGIEWDN